MLLALLAISQVTVAFANPFHKYPYVFLLDVGNEELEKTNTEQIRVSIPGGSVALRYPAIGNGETIAHVRVTGIDFGTDLKANIVDGGPGFKYVVLVFMGNKGVPYDAVVTMQTIPDSKDVYSYNIADGNGVNVDSSDQQNVEEDRNDSAEDTSDSETQYIDRTNSELTQSSSKVYNYAINEVNSNNQANTVGDESSDDTIDSDNYKTTNEETNKGENSSVNDDNAADIHKASPEPAYNTENVEVEDYADEIQAHKDDLQRKYDDYDEQQQPVRVDPNLYKMYEALRPHLYTGEVVPLQAYNEQSDKTEYRDDPSEIDQMFNDEEVHSDSDKYRDTNNNFDSDDSSAVAY